MTEVQMIGGDDRLLRVCDVCGGLDDHPRHVITGEEGQAGPPLATSVAAVLQNTAVTDDQRQAAINDLYDTSSQLRHRDCCRQVGCPTGTCDHIAELGGADLRGADLLALTVANQDALNERALAQSQAEHDAQRADVAAEQLAWAKSIVAASEGGQS